MQLLGSNGISSETMAEAMPLKNTPTIREFIKFEFQALLITSIILLKRPW